MRYLLILFAIALNADTLFAQIYDVVPRDLGEGHAGRVFSHNYRTGKFGIEGGTITVADGMITEWNIHVAGLSPHTFTHEDANAFAGGNISITPAEITFENTRANENYFMFQSDVTEEIECFGQCTATLAWDSRRQYLEYSIWEGSTQDVTPLAFARVDNIPSGQLLIATAVPEPSGFCLGIVGLGLGVTYRKRRLRSR